MNKNKLPIQWVLGIMIVLMATAYWTIQQTHSKNQTLSSRSSSAYSHNIFLQFLANLFGLRPQGLSPGYNGYNTSNQNAWQATGANGANQSNTSANSGNASMMQGANPTEGEYNAENMAGVNAENNSQFNAQMNEEMNAENMAGLNAENPGAENPQTNEEINSENPENNPQLNSENNPESNPETNEENPETNAEGNPGNTGPGPEGNPGGNSGCAPGCYPNCSPDCNAPGNNGGGYQGSESNLPTINPIPTDAQASQNTTQQNQQNDALAKLLASRQQLVVPAQEQAQASKYQTVKSQEIPAPSTNPAPSDIVQKLRANQIQLH